MLTPKQEVQRLLRHLPDDSTLEDIRHLITVLEKIHRSLDSLEEEAVRAADGKKKGLLGWLGR